jgi:transcription elongation GreA/GreB family factor
MTTKEILIGDNDEKKLQALLRSAGRRDAAGNSAIEKLEAVIRRATVLNSLKILEGVVTMNSLVQLLDLDSREKTECWLTFSVGIEPFPLVVPIVSDLGVALLGSREDDIIEWSGPSGRRRSK